MFTGIVEAVGKVVFWEKGVLRIQVPQAFVADEPIALGESVAVNGCCLTVVETGPDLAFELSPETIARTSFDETAVGDEVNLERAMKLSDRFGGHIVQGHVDATGRIVSVHPLDDHFQFRFQIPPQHDRYLIDKGSISIDGISLTVCEPRNGAFDVWIIPHTISHTNLGSKRIGASVNVEFDVLAKHVERLLQGSEPSGSASPNHPA